LRFLPFLTALAKTATSAGSARTQAVAGVAGALAVANSVDAAKDAVGAVKDIASGVKGLTSLGSITASVGFSKSKSTTASTDQTVVGSQIAGGDVNIIARGAGDASTINVIGSSVTATRDLTLSAPGAIIFKSAQEIDTSSSKNKSTGIDVGVTLSSSGLSPNASLNLGRGNSSGRDVTNIESVLSAGGTARIITPGALTLEGAQLVGNRVEVQAGSLAITSQQDTSVFKSKQTKIGLAVSADFGNSGSKGATNAAGDNGTGRSFGGAGASVSFGQTKQSGDFASVQEQSGISAGSGGFDIRVAGATTLTGGVIASTAEAANNQLTTGTLSATDLQNREKFKASSINLSASISGIGRPSTTTPPAGTNTGTTGTTPAGSTGNTAQVPANGQGEPTQGGNRTGTTAGLATRFGTIAAGLPSVANASGSQSSTTVSAIAQGGITVTSGDTASLNVAQSISRDTSTANEALTKQFTETKRADIAQGFAAAQALTQQVSVFFNNRAQDQATAKREAEGRETEAAAKERALRDGFTTDAAGTRTALTDAQRASLTQDVSILRGGVTVAGSIAASRDREADLRTQFGAGSATRILATAFSGAAGSNVAGGLGSLAQSAAVNVLQSLAVTQVKRIADSLGDKVTTINANGSVSVTYTPTAGSEAVRTALQAVVGCAGASAGGSAGCASAATGAAASVVTNYLLTSFVDPAPRDANGNITARTLEDQQARTNLVATFVAGIVTGAGGNTAAATTSAIIETQNNDLATATINNQQVPICVNNTRGCSSLNVQQTIARFRRGTPQRLAIDAIMDAYNTTDPDEVAAIYSRLGTGRIQFNPAIAEAARQEVQTRRSTIERLSGGNAQRRAALTRLSPTDLADAANFQDHFNRLSPTAQEEVRRDLANYNPKDPVANAAGRLVVALFGEANVQDLYFATTQGGADFRDLGGGLKDGVVDIATPIGRFLRDVAIVGSEYDPETGIRNPIFDTPEGQATLDAARARNSERFTTLATGAGNAAAGLGRLAADLAPPPWLGPNGQMLYQPTRVEIDAYNTRVTRGFNTVTTGIGNTVVAALTPLANVVDNCLVGNTPRACGRSIAPAAVEVGVAVVTEGAGTALRNGGRLVDNIPIPPRVAAGVNLDPRLPDPVAGLDYAPSRLSGGTEANQLSQINGYRAELEFANTIAAIPGETVVRFGSNVNTPGADIISVRADGTVSLFDTKFRSNPSNVQPTTTFAVDSNGRYLPPLENAVEQARRAIRSSNLPLDLQNRAILNLDAGNFNAHTPGAGAARNSAITRFCGGRICRN
jgi:hypothetical protein